jgi:ribosomal-protein-alanine N-acetyltransferase
MTKASSPERIEFVVEKANPEDLGDILEVMRPWNMHDVPSPEMQELDLACMFVVRVDDRIVGAAGYKLLSSTRAKTTLMGVLPEVIGAGIGRALQDARLSAMAAAGAKTVTTNADRPTTIHWYKKHYSYREVGTLKKLHSFGSPGIDNWTILEMDLRAW